MHLGIIGLPSSGKTTIFNALTGGDLPTGALAGGGRFEVHTAVVGVPDPRLEALSDLLQPRKTTYAKVIYADIGGLQVGVGREGLPGSLVNQLQQVDGLLHVVRAFDDPVFPHPAGSIDPTRDLEMMETEFLLHDMLTVERQLERLADERQKGGRDRETIDREITLFERLGKWLDQERPLRTFELSVDDAARLYTPSRHRSSRPTAAGHNRRRSPSPAARDRSSTTLAAATSCTPTPVRSQTVI